MKINISYNLCHACIDWYLKKTIKKQKQFQRVSMFAYGSMFHQSLNRYKKLDAATIGWLLYLTLKLTLTFIFEFDK